MLFDFLKKKMRAGSEKGVRSRKPNPDYVPPASVPPMPRIQYLSKITLYLCDGKACGDECPNPECKHTTDINHAKNFSLETVTCDSGFTQKYYIEEER